MQPKVEQRCYRCAGLGSSIPFGDFPKDVESINTGLVLLDYFLHAEKTKSGQNVIILQNRKDVKLSSWNTQRSIGNCIETCPRCINIYKRAKRLLNNISTLGKRKTLGVCSNCGIKIQTDPSHCKCNLIFKEFLISPAKDLDIDDHKNETCLSKPNHFTTALCKHEPGNNHVKLKTHSDSDFYLNKASKNYCGRKSVEKPTDGHQVKIKPLFQSEIDLSKLYITRTCHSFLQEQNATLGFRKTRLLIRKQPHDQTIQFYFKFPSKKKDLGSRLQVSSSQLLHDILANRKTNILEKKNFSAKTNKQTLPWQRDFSITNLQEKSVEFLYDIRAKYSEIKTLKDKILDERRSRDLEKKNLGTKTNKQTLPWQSDFSLLSLEGKALELLRDIRSKYMETKILEDKILDLGTENLGAKSDKRILPWERDFSLLGLEGDSLELLHDIRGKYRKTKILENKILAERRNSDLEIKNLGAKTNTQTLPLQTDSSLLSLKENSLELLNNIQAKYENKKRQLELIRDLEKKSLGTKTKKHRFSWQKEYSLLSMETKYEEKERKMKEQRNRELEKKIPGANIKKHELSRQNNYSLLKLEAKHEEKQKHSGDQRNRNLEKKIPGAKTKNNYSLLKLEGTDEEIQKHLKKQRSKDFEKKKNDAKTKDNGLPRQKDSSLLYLDVKYEENQKRLKKQSSKDLEKKKNYAKTKDNGLPWQKDSSLLYLDVKYEENQKRLKKQRSKDLEKKKNDAKTKDNGLPRQKDSSLLYLDVKYEENQKRLKKQRSKDLEKKKNDAKTKDNGLPWQKDSSLLYLDVKYEENQKRLKKQRSKDLEKKKHDAKTKDNGLPRQKDSSLLYLDVKYEEDQKRLEKRRSKDDQRSGDQRNRNLEKKKLGAKTKQNGLPSQKDSSLLSIEVKYEKKKRRLEDQLSRDLDRTESKNLGAKTKNYKSPWPKKDSAHLNLEEETATIKQANVIIDEPTKTYHKKKHGLNKKEDSFNELHDSDSEIRLVRKSSKEIEERRKKKQAVLELLTRMDRNNSSDIRLSHRRLLDTKSSKLPTRKAERKMNVYRMVLSRPELDWFAKNKFKRKMFYDSGEILAEFSEDGRSRWFYRDGQLALDYYYTKKTPPGRRYVVYSSEKPDRKGRLRPQTVLASFDHSGNAVILDHAGNIRLKYDQNEGIVLDPSIGPVSHWKWHSLKDYPAATDTEMPFIHPGIQMSEEDELGKEIEHTLKVREHKIDSKTSAHEKSKKMTQSYKRFEIKMKALKINEYFSLKILDQAKVHLIYRDDTTHIKINIGMTLNRMDLVDIETCHVGRVFNPLEKFPADTQSLVELQRTVAQARHAERARVRRLGRLMRPSFVC